MWNSALIKLWPKSDLNVAFVAASNILSLVDALSSAKLNCIEYFNFFYNNSKLWAPNFKVSYSRY